MKRGIVRLLVALLAASSVDAASSTNSAAKTRELVAMLQDASASTFEKARACQQLGIIGTGDAIPVLATMLDHEQLAHYAREALEAMADPSADAALRAALGRLRGNHLVGVVNSLGMRRDAEAVPALVKVANDPASPASGAAWLALARIGNSEAAAAVRGALSSASAEQRPKVAEGALLLADRLVGTGKAAEALSLYDAVRAASLPEPLKLSALRGALLTRDGRAALPLLMETLRSADEAVRNVGLRAIRDLTAREVTPALVAELAGFSPQVQAAVIVALVDRGDVRALAAIELAAGAKDEVVRVAALRALGKLGRSSSVPLLLHALASGGSGAEVETAQRSLTQIQASNTEGLMLTAFNSADGSIRVRLIAIMGERGSPTATAAIMGLARDSDAATSHAALRALAQLARPGDLTELIALAAVLTEDDARTLADRAIYAASMKILEPSKRAEPILAAVREAKDPATRAALMRPLGAIVRAMGGNAEARALVIAGLKEKNEDVRTASAKVLADWPDASVAAALMEFLRTEPNATQRAIAFDGAVRMAERIAGGKDKASLDAVAMFTALNADVRSDAERMKMVSGLGSLRRTEAFKMLVPYLDVAAVKTETALAIVQIAPALLGGREAAAVRSALQRIANEERDADVKARAAHLLKNGAPEGTKKGKAKKA